MDLSRKKLEVEKMKVSASKAEMELNILKHMEDIERIKKSIKAQEERILEIDELLKGE